MIQKTVEKPAESNLNSWEACWV